jgi:hypothetical protein
MLYSVIVLFLHVNRFHSIPMVYKRRVFDPQSVTELWFSRNTIEHMPKTLYLGQYCCTGYRCYIGVIVLFLHVNRFHSIPMVYNRRVFDSQSVSELWFSRNTIEHMPKTLYLGQYCCTGYRCYISVIVLFLRVNRFHSIPMVYKRLVIDPQSVSELWFSRNTIEHMPKTLYIGSIAVPGIDVI